VADGGAIDERNRAQLLDLPALHIHRNKHVEIPIRAVPHHHALEMQLLPDAGAVLEVGVVR